MKKLIITLTILLPGLISSQVAAIKKADKLYNTYSYSGVISKLEGKKDISTKSKRELALSYKMMENYSKAEESYSDLMNAPDKTADDVLAYAQILKMNGKYKEAIAQMDVYSSLNTSDSRTVFLKENKNYTEELLKDKGQFKIKHLEMNTPEQDFGAIYYNDELVYASSRTDIGIAKRRWNGNNLAYLDLFKAKVDSTGELKNSTRIKEQNRKYHEGPASYDKLGLHSFITRNNYTAKSTDGVTKLELFESQLVNNKWTEPKSFPYNDKEYSVGHPALTADGKTLYFASDMPGGKGGVDIYKCVKTSDTTWSKPENLGDKINTEGNEMFPFIHESGLFFFSSDGLPGLGGLDIYSTEIKNEQIGKVINLGAPVNGSKDDFSFIMNTGISKGYFASNREGGKGNDDIYYFDVTKPFKFKKIIKGVAKDKEGTILSTAIVSLKEVNGAEPKSITTASDGAYSFEVDADKDFELNGEKEKYFEGKNTANTKGSEEVVIADVVLEKIPEFSLLALVTDNKTKEPIEGVVMKITDESGKLVDFTTPATGDYKTLLENKKLGDNIKYTITLTKKGYLSKTVEFTKTLDKPGEVKVHEALDMSMGKIEVGTDIGKLININPIYFDVNKSNIRPDAAIELDKIVKAMQEYPAMVIELGSHTDCRAPKAYNASLSDRRAKSSAAYVISKGITKDRIYGKGYGESKLINGCACEGIVKSTCSEEEHQKNRRTEFIIVKLKD